MMLPFFKSSLTGRSLVSGARMALIVIGILYLVVALTNVFGGGCLLPRSVACPF